jgi:hypothetical protein
MHPLFLAALEKDARIWGSGMELRAFLLFGCELRGAGGACSVGTELTSWTVSMLTRVDLEKWCEGGFYRCLDFDE